jgi:predicted nucleotidyltransferase
MAKKAIVKAKNILFKLLWDRNINVDKIIIYGSYARNTTRPESDIDMMVVSRDFRNKDIFQKVAMVRGIHSDIVRQINKPVDLLFYSDKEWENGTSILINTAKNEGLVFSPKQ